MCDTIVALGSATADGSVLFGKNSDREPDEVQNIKIHPRQHKPDEHVKCTHISIPQVSETARVLLCQPFWMFGAEMGANEYGVVIGNEALFTREKPSPTGLTGMDLLRLALERSRTAREALETIIELLEKYGQGGNCGYRHKLFYMNSFLIADPKEAYVLETVKSWWAWKQVKDCWSISNIISLEKDFDACSPGLIENAISKGYCKSEADFSFRRCYSDRIITWGARGAQRERRSRMLLSQRSGTLTTADFMAILRDHGDNPFWTPDRSGGTICMHAADKLIRRSQSVCSLVAKLEERTQFYYTTGAANPCLSPYYPVFLPDTVNPEGYVEGGADYSEASYWWQCEKLHRRALWHFTAALDAIQPVIAEYEGEMLAAVEGGAVPFNQKTVDEYFTRARAITRDCGGRLASLPLRRPRLLFRCYWRGYNRLNRIE
ncbi:MAG TPA: peptidase U34 [Dehalococcoidia bacterium]|nr:peptidase U34 [Dehalococcoidia bacterium]